MNNTTILALASLVALTSTACLSDDGETADGFSTSVGYSNGKGDEAGSRNLEFLSAGSRKIWSAEGLHWVGKKTLTGKIQVITATDEKVVSKSDIITSSVMVYGSHTIPDSKDHGAGKYGPWTGSKLLDVQISSKGDAGAAMVMQYGSSFVECNGVSAFRRIVVNAASKEFHIDDAKTFSFAQCGVGLGHPSIPENGHAWSEVSIYPIIVAGTKLVGTHDYVLTAELIGHSPEN